MSKKKPKRKKVWVLIHRHRHGEDVTVYSTNAKALASASEIVTERLDELGDEELKTDVLALFKEGKLYDGLRDWSQFEADHDGGRGEYIDIEESQLF